MPALILTLGPRLVELTLPCALTKVPAGTGGLGYWIHGLHRGQPGVGILNIQSSARTVNPDKYASGRYV